MEHILHYNPGGNRHQTATLGNGNNNNYALASEGVQVLRATADSGGSTITGIAGGTNWAGRRLLIRSMSANVLTLANESANSAGANRITSGTGANLTFAVNDTVELEYDLTSARWIVIGTTI